MHEIELQNVGVVGAGELQSSEVVVHRPSPPIRILLKILHCLCGKRNKEPSCSTRIVYFNDSVRTFSSPESDQFKSNEVQTSKYTWYNFLPKFLVEAFSKFANAYFLVVSALQMIPSISITNGIPYNAGPLFVVLFVEALSLLLEDRQRKMDDRAANDSICRKLDEGSFQECRWRDIVPGDIVCVENREIIPADLAILSTSNAGQAFVETKSLDGETNLKLRNAASGDLITSNFGALKGHIEFQQPDAEIEVFHGRTRCVTADSMQIDCELLAENLVLRGCVLRNTNDLVGVALNCGGDSKILMSTSETEGKLSDLDRKINSYLGLFVALEFVICVVATAFSSSWFKKSGVGAFYLDIEDFPTSKYVRRIFTFFLLIANMIPIALYVAMKFARFFQAQIMMLDERFSFKDESLEVRAMDLNDTLGEISHIFTDKTGTLTQNLMEFRKCSISGVSFGAGATLIGISALERTGRQDEADKLREEITTLPSLRADFVNFQDDPANSLIEVLHSNDEYMENQRRSCEDFLVALALCHEVLLERVQDAHGNFTGDVRLSGASPDEQALVSAASRFGVGYRGKYQDSNGEFAEISLQNNMQTFQILQLFRFTSARKRMSILVKNVDTDELKLFCKGADEEIFSRLSQNQDQLVFDATKRHITSFAQEGLRTMAVACRNLSHEQYISWKQLFDESPKDEEISSIEGFENELFLLGATGIEDRLQDGVPDTVMKLLEAGMTIWMLTGDKRETALNIGFACNLLVDEAEIVHFDEDPIVAKSQLDALAGSLPEMSTLVLEGKAIDVAFQHGELFAKICARRCKSVIACRASPLQKAKLVELVKKTGSAKTLAIGDGANDIPMIQQAHVGVGISGGNEGRAAANSSEYSIAQFRFLQQLLFVHGRNNYRRMSKLILFMFYKNIMLTGAQFLLSFANGWSGQKFYLELGLQSFNLVFTMLPSFLLAIFDEDLPPSVVLCFPKLYHELGIQNLLFSASVFWQWIANALIHAVIIFWAAAVLWPSRDYGLWSQGCLTFTIVVLVVNVKIVLEQSAWRWFNVLGFVLTLISWPLFASFLELPFWGNIGADWGTRWLFVFRHMLRSSAAWAVISLACTACLVRDFSTKAWGRLFHPKFFHIVQECIKFDFKLPHRDEMVVRDGGSPRFEQILRHNSERDL